MKLVHLGYGTLSDVRKMNAREVLQAIYYDSYLNDYENAYLELNKNGD